MGKILFDVLNIDNNVANTGIPDINYDPSNIEGVLLLKRGAVITKADALAIQSYIAGKLKHDTPSQRWYILKRFEGCEDKKTEGVYTESGYGVRRKVRNGKYAWRWEYKDGGLDLHTKFSTFDRKQNQFDALLIDPVNNCFWGTKSGTSLKGFRLDMIDIPNFDSNTGAETSKYYVELVLADEKEINRNARIVALPEDFSIMEDYNSLLDTEMQVEIAMDPTGLVSLGFKAGKADLYPDYKGTLDEPTLYVATVSDTGAVLDIDSVAANDATNNIDIQLDATDPDFPAAGTLIKITFGPVSAIDTAGMPGYSEAEVITPLG
jgi:hypothetical protein